MYVLLYNIYDDPVYFVYLPGPYFWLHSELRSNDMMLCWFIRK